MGCGSSKIESQPSNNNEALKALEIKSLDDISDLEDDESLIELRADISCLGDGEVFLNLTDKSLGDKEARLVVALLNNMEHSLESVYFNENDIGPEGAAYIAELLKNNKTITELDLENNNLGDQGASALGKMLSTNESLLKLDLTNTNIGDRGAQDIGIGLSNNSTLEKLEIDENNIADAGATGLMKFHENNSSQLTILVLSGNGIGKSGTQAIAKALSTNPQLRDLYLSKNKIDDGGSKILANALAKKNTNLKLLDIDDNNMSEKGATEFCEIMKNSNNSSLDYTTKVAERRLSRVTSKF